MFKPIDFFEMQRNTYISSCVIEKRFTSNKFFLYLRWYVRFWVHFFSFLAVLIYSLFFHRKKIYTDDIFICHHKRCFYPLLLDKVVLVKIYPSLKNNIFLFLPRLILIKKFIKSFFEFTKFKFGIKDRVARKGWYFYTFKYGGMFSFINYFAHVILHEFFCFYPQQKLKIGVSGHFETFINLSSRARIEGLISNLTLHQHGAFEDPINNHEFEKCFFDNVYLRYIQSERWLKEKFISNQYCIFLPPPISPGFIHSLCENKFVVAYASSGDLQVDETVCNFLISLKKKIVNRY